MTDYPDINYLPEVVYVSMEEISQDIYGLLAIRGNNLSELNYLLESVINVITINSNYTDNLQCLLEEFKNSIITKEDRSVCDKYNLLMAKMANLLVYKFKQLRLYAFDDTAYYMLQNTHSAILFSLVRVNPTQYWRQMSVY